MKEFIITSDQMKMLAESVGYFVDEPISEVVIGGETLPDADELRAKNVRLQELCKTLYQLADESYVPLKIVNRWMDDFEKAICAMRELGIEVSE